MAYIAHIPEWFSARKAAQVAAYFVLKAGGKINILRATKLVYLADRASMDQREHPITGDDFVSMPFGPVNTYTYSLMKGEVDEGQKAIWSEYMAPRNRNTLTTSKPLELTDFDELSRADVRVLNETWERFKDIPDQFDLAEWTHKYCPEWRDPNGSSIPIAFATVFKRLDKPEPIELGEQIQAERAFIASLAS